MTVAVRKLEQGKARAEAGLGQAKPASTAGAAAGDVVHASVNAVGRALLTLCLADAVLRAAASAVAKLVVSGGKAWHRPDALSDNHSPPPPPATRHASLPLALAGLLFGFAPTVAAGKASERTKASAREAKALLDCSPSGASCSSTVPATTSIASERTKGAATGRPGNARLLAVWK